MKMHADEVETSVALVEGLIAAQFPQWTGLCVEPVSSSGADNALYRLGADRVVRLPRIQKASDLMDKECAWLPRLAPFLPLSIPVPLAKGEPGSGYPWRWSVYRWLKGENATLERLADPRQATVDLARFIAALQAIDATDGPHPHDVARGGPLFMRDRETRAALETLYGVIDVDAATAVWTAATMAPAWARPPVWIHGDLQSGNLLADQGRLSAVIDFGCMAVGDPAYDIMAAWLYLNSETRSLFRETLQTDEATWTRGSGLAVSVGVVALPYYQHTNPTLAGIARRAIDEAIEDYRENG
jgi:aminoglycoside phosphotransferase (APT) family kinase protein